MFIKQTIFPESNLALNSSVSQPPVFPGGQKPAVLSLVCTILVCLYPPSLCLIFLKHRERRLEDEFCVSLSFSMFATNCSIKAPMSHFVYLCGEACVCSVYPPGECVSKFISLSLSVLLSATQHLPGVMMPPFSCPSRLFSSSDSSKIIFPPWTFDDGSR